MQKIVSILSSISLIAVLNTALAESETDANINQAESSERVAYLDPELKKQMALARNLKGHETVWLDVNYPDIPDAIKVLAIASPSLIAEKKGAVLLLHDKEQHADWPEIIRPLRKNLPKSGWFTLSVNLPDETRIQQPERALEAKAFDQLVMNESLKKNLESGVRVRNELVKNDADESIDNEDANASTAEPEQVKDDNGSVDIDLALTQAKPGRNKIPYTLRSLSHIEKAYEYLQSQEYQNIVFIAYGKSTELAFQYIKAHQAETNSPGFALVLIEPYLPETYLLDWTEWLGKDFQAPILEIIDRNNTKAIEAAESRKYSALRAGIKNYRQALLSINYNEVFDENLSRRVRSWLDSSAPGQELGP